MLFLEAAYKVGTPKVDSVTGWQLANSVRSVCSFAMEVKVQRSPPAKGTMS
jgi:hypothetical protein